MAIIRNFFGKDIDSETVKKPSDLYRLMRPEYFSDSPVEKEKIDREQFQEESAEVADYTRDGENAGED